MREFKRLASIYSLVVSTAIATAACGGSNPDASDSGPPGPDADNRVVTSLRVVPDEKTFTVVNNEAEQYRFHAIATLDDGSERDMTDEVIWDSYNSSLILLEEGGHARTTTLFTGTTQVTARRGQIMAASDVTIRQRREVVATGVDVDTPNDFDTAAIDGQVGRAPGLYYPFTPTVIPMNMGGVEFHFLRGNGNDVYELTLAYDLMEYKHYASCSPVGSGCVIIPDGNHWQEIADVAAGHDLEVRVAGMSSANPTTKGESRTYELKLTGQPLTAGLYYWAATDGRIHRFDFGHAGVPPEPWYPGPGDPNCAACHSLSRDGSLAATDRGGGTFAFEVIDVATKTVLWGSQDGFAKTAFSPDNVMLLTTASAFGGQGLRVLDAMTGADLGFNLSTNPTDSPDWSADGTWITYAENGAIKLQPWDGTNFGLASTLYPSNAANPAFTPDSAYVLFTITGGPTGWGQELWTLPVNAPPGMAPIKLEGANGGWYDNTWCKISPNMLPYSDGEVAFVAFSTRRPIGLRPETSINQLWISAFDPAKAAAGDDPTFQAVHMPWQSQVDGNHIAQWVIDIPHEPCGPQGECPKEFTCENGECIQIPQ